MALKVSHTATAPPPELLPAELNEVLRLTQQMLNRKPLMEKMKATLAAFFSGRLCHWSMSARRSLGMHWTWWAYLHCMLAVTDCSTEGPGSSLPRTVITSSLLHWNWSGMSEVTDCGKSDCHWWFCCLWEWRDWSADWLLRGPGTAQDLDDWAHRRMTGPHWVVHHGTTELVVHCPLSTVAPDACRMARVHTVKRWGHCTAIPQPTEVETDRFHWRPWTPQLQSTVDCNPLWCFHWKSLSSRRQCVLDWLVSRWVDWQRWLLNWMWSTCLDTTAVDWSDTLPWLPVKEWCWA